MGEWVERPLAELTELVSRGTAPRYVAASSVRAVGQRCVQVGRFDPTAARPHDETSIDGVLWIQKDDVLLNSTGTGTIGRSCVYPGGGRYIVDSHVTVIRARPGMADGRFLSACIQSPAGQSYLERQCYSGSTNQVELGASGLRRWVRRWPDLAEQQRIAEVLDALADTIAASERLLAKGRAVVDGVIGGLLSSVWHNADGLRPLGEVLSERPRNGHSPVEATDWHGAYLLGLGCLTFDGFSPRQLKNAPAGDPRLRRALLSDGDLLISRSNTREAVGLVGRFRALDAPSYYPDLMMRLRPSGEVRADYLELVLRSHPARRYLQSRAAGTSGSMVKIGAGTLVGMPIPVPSLDRQAELVMRAQVAAEPRDLERTRLLKLRGVRAGLAEDLLTGRVRTVPA